MARKASAANVAVETAVAAKTHKRVDTWHRSLQSRPTTHRARHVKRKTTVLATPPIIVAPGKGPCNT